MKHLHTQINGVFIVETDILTDHRGTFARLYCERELSAVIGERRIVQINQSYTATPGAVRGLHYQHSPHAEMKLIRCIKGRVWDVVVDLRAGSPTMLQWYAEELTPENARMLVIPEGCAHGFQVLDPESELLYLHTGFYMPGVEDGVACDDPRLAITWPLPIVDLSERDQQHPPIPLDFSGNII